VDVSPQQLDDAPPASGPETHWTGRGPSGSQARWTSRDR
jgi:hypothetical protein